MTERTYTTRLVKRLRQAFPNAVVIKHADNFTGGVPDLSVTLGGRTWWVEVKVGDELADCLRHVTTLQRRTMNQLHLASHGHAYYTFGVKGTHTYLDLLANAALQVLPSSDLVAVIQRSLLL